MTHYTAKMKYSEETVYKLVETQYTAFHTDQKLMILCTAAALLFAGFLAGLSSIIGIVLLLIGSILLTGSNTRPRAMAKIFIRQLAGKYPGFTYDFGDNEFSVREEGNPVKYSSLICLMEDSSYMYLYTTPEKAYMISSSSVKGDDGLDGFKGFIAEHSGLEWERGLSLFTMNGKKFRRTLERVHLRKEYEKGAVQQ